MSNRDSFIKVLKALLIVAAVGFVVVKIYQKFFKNKSVDMINDLQELEELEMLEEAEAAEAACAACESCDACDGCDVADEAEVVDVAEDAAFEVAADDVIANAGDME